MLVLKYGCKLNNKINRSHFNDKFNVTLSMSGYPAQALKLIPPPPVSQLCFPLAQCLCFPLRLKFSFILI